MTVHEIRLREPQVDGHTVTFAWTVTPDTALYLRHEFTLDFPATADPSAVPVGLWWRIALACLHPHWVLLGPCRVVLPVRLAPGEREAWLRLCDAAVWALEARAGDRDVARRVDLVESGAPLAPLTPGADCGLSAVCFSGGRDSLVQTALVQELGETPLLVTTTSPREGSIEHVHARRRVALEAIVQRRDLELVEVRSDFRMLVRNDFAAGRYACGVTELTDCLLYFGVALAVAAARGARRIAMASEYDIQATERRDGRIVQFHHFMYTQVTQLALQAMIAPTRIRFGGLTSSMMQFQLQRLLSLRYPDLRDLQLSCWTLRDDEQACSACFECARNALNLAADGVSPAVAGMNLETTIHRRASWWYDSSDPNSSAALGLGRSVRDPMYQQILRCLHALAPERMAAFIGDPAVLADYARLRIDTLAADGPPDPEPGYAAAFLRFVDEPLRGGLAAIVGEHFVPVADGSDVAAAERSRTLADWISAPLRDPQLDRRRRDSRPGAAPVR